MPKQSAPEILERRLKGPPRSDIPEGYIALKTAIGRVGRAKFGEAWTEVVERKRAHVRAEAAWDLGQPLDGAVVTPKQLQEAKRLWNEIKPRYVAATTQVRKFLAEGQLTAFEFGDGELPRPMGDDFWRTMRADIVLKQGKHWQKDQWSTLIEARDLESLDRQYYGSKKLLVIVAEDELGKLLNDIESGAVAIPTRVAKPTRTTGRTPGHGALDDDAAVAEIERLVAKGMTPWSAKDKAVDLADERGISFEQNALRIYKKYMRLYG